MSSSISDEQDLLPSFQMHENLLNSKIDEELFTNDTKPPMYVESVHETLCSSHGLSSSVSERHQDTSKLLLNNLDKMQRLTLPIAANITITTNQPTIGQPFTKRNPLKPFFPGETVHGFITFENKSKLDIPFEMLLVSLECEIGVMHPTKKCIVKKKLITCYDLEASFNFLGLAGDQDICHAYDESDNTFVGFDRRNLKPGVSIKKFFRFKIPNYLLDDCCKDQVFQHLHAPVTFGGNNTNAEIDHRLGYGRDQYCIGSPVKLNDYAQNNAYCSYFVYAQMIGKNREEYKPYYTDSTKDFDLIFIRNVEHHILVGRKPNSENEDCMFSNGSTKDQMDYFFKLAVETLDVLAEREMLMKAGVLTHNEQDEIIYSTNGKCKLLHVDGLESSSDLKSTPVHQSSLEFFYKKDLFNKINGLLTVNCKINKNSTIPNAFPTLIEKTKLFNIFQVSEASKGPIITMDLKFKSKSNNGNPVLPTSITVKPQLVNGSVFSPYPIPVSFDQEFMQTDTKIIRETFAKIALYFNKINNVIKENGLQIPKVTLDSLKGLGSCRYSQVTIPGVFIEQTINIDNEWTYNSDSQLYECTLQIPLDLNVPGLTKAPKAIISSFQTCLFSQLHKIEIDVTPRKGLTKKATLPIIVQ